MCQGLYIGQQLYFLSVLVCPRVVLLRLLTLMLGFQLILDLHSALLVGERGYKIAFTRIIVSKPTYADDVGLVKKTARACQESVNSFNDSVRWSRTMKLKIPKCRSLAFRVFMTRPTS